MNKVEREQAKDFGSLFQEIKTDLTSYINHRITHYRLDLLERMSKSSSLLSIGLIIAFLGLGALSFALIALAFQIGQWLGSTAAGFGVVALFWLFLLILVILFREPIKRFFLNRTVRLLYKIEREDLDDDE